MILIGLKTCSTCKAIEKQLKKQGINYDYWDVRLNPPSRDAIEQIVEIIGQDQMKTMVNIAGQSYRSGDYKTKWPQMTLDQRIDALAQDGMLIKRPILWLQDGSVYIGREVDNYLATLGEK